MATTQKDAQTVLVYYWDEMKEVPFVKLKEAFEEVEERKADSFYVSSNGERAVYPDWVKLNSEAIYDLINNHYGLVYPFSPQNYYFEIVEREDETLIFLKYQHIIGSRLVAKLDLEGGKA